MGPWRRSRCPWQTPQSRRNLLCISSSILDKPMWFHHQRRQIFQPLSGESRFSSRCETMASVTKTPEERPSPGWLVTRVREEPRMIQESSWTDSKKIGVKNALQSSATQFSCVSWLVTYQNINATNDATVQYKRYKLWIWWYCLMTLDDDIGWLYHLMVLDFCIVQYDAIGCIITECHNSQNARTNRIPNSSIMVFQRLWLSDTSYPHLQALQYEECTREWRPEQGIGWMQQAPWMDPYTLYASELLPEKEKTASAYAPRKWSSPYTVYCLGILRLWWRMTLLRSSFGFEILAEVFLRTISQHLPLLSFLVAVNYFGSPTIAWYLEEGSVHVRPWDIFPQLRKFSLTTCPEAELPTCRCSSLSSASVLETLTLVASLEMRIGGLMEENDDQERMTWCI